MFEYQDLTCIYEYEIIVEQWIEIGIKESYYNICRRENRCRDRQTNWWCTRTVGHLGPHVACALYKQYESDSGEEEVIYITSWNQTILK